MGKTAFYEDPNRLTGPTGRPLAEYTVAELDEETVQNAVVQTAFAYRLHNPYVQYDIGYVTVYATSRAGSRRLNCREAPEQSGYDTQLYTSCTKYIFAVYHNAFDFEMPGYDTWWEKEYDMSPDGEIVVVKYGDVYGSCGETDRAKATAMVDEKILPGDIVFASPHQDPSGGHTMLYVGNYKGDGKRYVLHSWPVDGGRLNKQTGEDKLEPYGAITLQTFEDLILTKHGKPNYCIDEDRMGFFFLLRLANSEAFRKHHLTPSAVTRLQYPFLAVDKTADRWIYDDVLPGECVTVTETVRNCSKKAWDELTVQERIPEGASLVSARGAKVDGDLLVWKMTLGAGEEFKIVYTVKNEKKRGETLEFEAGRCGEIPTRHLSFKVGGKRLTQEQTEMLHALEDKDLSRIFPAGGAYDLGSVNTFYRTVLGAKCSLPPTLGEFLNENFERITPEGKDFRMFVPKETKNAQTEAMKVNRTLTGQYLFTGSDASGRIFDILPQYFTPGDVLVTYHEPSAEEDAIRDKGVFYVCLGGDRVLQIDRDGARIASFRSTAQRCLLAGIFIALRPTMGADDIFA